MTETIVYLVQNAAGDYWDGYAFWVSSWKKAAIYKSKEVAESVASEVEGFVAPRRISHDL